MVTRPPSRSALLGRLSCRSSAKVEMSSTASSKARASLRTSSSVMTCRGSWEGMFVRLPGTTKIGTLKSWTKKASPLTEWSGARLLVQAFLTLLTTMSPRASLKSRAASSGITSVSGCDLKAGSQPSPAATMMTTAPDFTSFSSVASPCVFW